MTSVGSTCTGFNWSAFDRLGWSTVKQDKHLLRWIICAKNTSCKKLFENEVYRSELRCGGTWFVGANYLQNDGSGRLNNVAFEGKAVDSIMHKYGKFFNDWDKAQISICYEGYPKPSKGETLKSFNYRKDKFGAHVDGILPVGKGKRRYAREYHTFILGIPLVNFNEFAAPVVVWEGSHRIVRSFLSQTLLKTPIKVWKDQDITELYHNARRQVFLKCKRKTIIVPLGGSYILHRLTLHGIMPWGQFGKAEDDCRMIAYFRPILNKPEYWLNRVI